MEFTAATATRLAVAAALSEHSAAPRIRQLVEGQILVPPTAAERKGIQPVVTLQVNGAIRADVKVGQAVEFTADIETPPDSGLVVSAEWDFDAGPQVLAGESGRFPVSERFTPAPHVTLARTHTFTKPGTYFPALLACSQRDGDASTPCDQIPNLGRVRVVVT